MSSLIDWVAGYADLGWTPVRVKYQSKQPFDANWGSGFADAARLHAAFSTGEWNVGLALGKPSGNLVDVDLDAMEAVAVAPYFLPPTTWRFGRPGKPNSHWLYVCSNTATCQVGEKGAMLVELRSTGAQTVVPPSVHVSGEQIAWCPENDFTLPPPVVDGDVLKRAVHKVGVAAFLLRRFPEQGHDARLAISGWLARQGWPESEVTSFLHALMQARGHGDDDVDALVHGTFERLANMDTKMPVRGLNACREIFQLSSQDVKLIYRWERVAAPEGADPFRAAYNQTDGGVADRFLQDNLDYFRFCYPKGCWYTWEEGYWQKDAVGAATRVMHETIREIQKEAAAIRTTSTNGVEDDSERKRAVRWAKSVENKSHMDSALFIAKSHASIPISDFDSDPFILNVENGILDLRDGSLSPHSPSRFLTAKAGVTFDPLAVAPRFLQFMEEVFPDPQVRRFMQVYFGYTLTGLSVEHVFPIFWGDGANGKSTLVELWRTMMGGYSTTLPSEAVINTGHDRHPADLARLLGKRFACISESDQNRSLNEGKVKQLTGGEVMAVRGMREDFWDLPPSYKIVMLTNHLPGVQGQDSGIWRRLALVPFSVNFQGREDKHLRERMLNEASGILNWALEGLRIWQSEGLVRPPAVVMSTDNYRHEEDATDEFLSDTYVRDPEGSITAAQLQTDYAMWCSLNNERPLKGKALGALLRAKGFQPFRTNEARGWLGIKRRVNQVNHLKIMEGGKK